MYSTRMVMPERPPAPAQSGAKQAESGSAAQSKFQELMRQKRRTGETPEQGGSTRRPAEKTGERAEDGGAVQAKEVPVESALNAQILLAALDPAQFAVRTVLPEAQETQLPGAPAHAAAPPAVSLTTPATVTPMTTGGAEGTEKRSERPAEEPAAALAKGAAERAPSGAPEGARGARVSGVKPGPLSEAPAASQSDGRGPVKGEEPHPAEVLSQTPPAPLFRDVEAAPIQVGNAVETERSEKPVPVERQILQQLKGAAERGESHIRVALRPESLGSVTVDLIRGHGDELHVILSAENPRSQLILERGAAGLQSALADHSPGAVQVQVERQPEGQQSQNHTFDQGSQGGGQQQDQSGRHHARGGNDFLQQLRLGMIPLDDAAG